MNGGPAFSPASERNKFPILEQLRKWLSPGARVLEIGSGLGQHAAFFCEAMPSLKWQVSERSAALPDLECGLLTLGADHLRSPLQLDVLEDPWPGSLFDAVYTANTAHIMPWEGVEHLVRGAANSLEPGGMLIFYGPFNIGGRYTSEGNRAFDADLRERDCGMGIRNVEDIDKLARRQHMMLHERIDMPANNMMLVYARD